MQLNLNRFLSDRLIFEESLPEKVRVARSFWNWVVRIISWIFSPKCYTDENRRSVQCFRKYLVDTLGEERLKRVCTRYSVDFDEMQKKGNPLLSRDVAKIVVGTKNVTVEDVGGNFLELTKEELARRVEQLSNAITEHLQVADVAGKISGRSTEWIARIFYDPMLNDRERLQLVKEHPTDSFETFMHNMAARVIKREMDVGTLVLAPNGEDGQKQYYYVSGKVITGEGMVSYLFHPATNNTNLEPIRLFRGTSARFSEIDGISSVITDLEKDLGRSAFESGEVYERFIPNPPTIEGGHSLGATLVQYRLANRNHIREAYLYCAPGVPKEDLARFNRKRSPVKLTIRRSAKDPWSLSGHAHLGFQAPESVEICFRKYHPPRKKRNESAHTTVWPREKYYGIEGGMQDSELLCHANLKEKVRSKIGPVFASTLRCMRNGYRSLFKSRLNDELGLKIGSIQEGRWKVDHFRPL